MKKLIKYTLSFAFAFILAFSFAINAYAVESSTQPATQYIKSMVKSITVEGGTFTTDFKAGNYTYSVYLREFQENLSITVELNNQRFEYEMNGEKRLVRESDNIVVIKVTDPNGEYSDEKYTLNIFFDTVGLTYLDVENGIFSPQFDKFHSTYYAILENKIDSFEAAGVNWKTANKDAVVEVECLGELNEDGTLPEGKRTDYKLKVCETDGTSKNYKLRLYRKSSTVSAIDENAMLASIKINGGAVEMPAFRQQQSFYDVIVPASIDKLDVQAYPADRSNVAQVIGNTVMRADEPVYITIVVTSEKYGTSSYYTLRCQYETAMFTEKHTDLQLLAYVSVALFSGFIIGLATALLIRNIKRRKQKSITKYKHFEKEGAAVEQTEYTTEQ